MLQTRLKDILRTTGKHLKKLEFLGISTIRDFLLYFPRTYTDSREIRRIIDMKIDEPNVIKGRISSFFSRKTKNGKFMTRALLTDETGSIEVIWFNQPHITRMIPNGSTVILTGKLKYSFGKISMISPAYEIEKKEQIHSGRIVPVYHETEGISSKWMREKLKPIIDDWASEIVEYMLEEILKRHKLMPLSEAVKEIHFPENETQIEKARARLAFDELFLIQFKALKKRWEWQRVAENQKCALEIDGSVIKEFVERLPFKLTKAQERTAKEILQDLSRKHPMSRLVQGDVGSGKTVVAAIGILATTKSGKQVALMAPTEILAKQHYKTLSELLIPFGINIQFISGSTTKKQKKEIIKQMKTGTCDLVVGTHALIQEEIGFKNLGLAIVDEQHRFGVKQRSILKS
ncbi:DEAD/DEAH box helicase, partial [Patescibacteria group bacterium]|nr:DEAD/DEAH box helicase [Patescibacteria group bacterium]